MNKWRYFLFYLLALAPVLSYPAKKNIKPQLPSHYQSIYRTLDPTSIAENLAFYELYPETEEGKKALETAWILLFGSKAPPLEVVELPHIDVHDIISLITKEETPATTMMTEGQLCLFEKAAYRLKNRQLKGYSAWSKEEVLSLPSDEIDLGRALLLYQFQNDEDAKKKIRSYEATLDLMALQILARIKEKASIEDMIAQINHFIFYDMRFRFPPHSIHIKDIDLYTYLPSVIDSRLGVCLGVSTLYLCLAQRIGLDLDIITPPGHIYICYDMDGKLINIETTARGINLPTDTYLGINTAKLKKRNMKEVVGMAFFNQAPIFSRKEDFQSAIELYQRALEYMPDDPLVKMLLGINYLFIGNKKAGETLMKEVRGLTFEGEVTPETIPEDYLSGRTDAKGIKMIFMPVDETRESIIKKQQELKIHLKKYPKFRAGILQLAITYLQLGRSQEGYDVLMKYHAIDPNNPMVEYYLSMICLQRLDYMQAWSFYQNAEAIVTQAHHHPKALKGLKATLQRSCPNPY